MEFADIRELVIVALFSEDRLLDQLVLKGGNAISLIYGYGSRGSLDIDCSIDGDFDHPEEIGLLLKGVLRKRFGEIGHEIFDFSFEKKPAVTREGSNTRWGGYVAEFKIIDRSQVEKLGTDLERMRRSAIEIGPSQQRIFRIDFSKYEYCATKQLGELNDYAIYVYTPEMLSLEKLRAICQQMVEYAPQRNRSPRARDFYDIYVVINGAKIEWSEQQNLTLAQNIFAAKDVPLRLIELIPRYRDFHEQDWPAVENSVSENLPKFEFYFDFVVEQSKKLEPLWII